MSQKPVSQSASHCMPSGMLFEMGADPDALPCQRSPRSSSQSGCRPTWPCTHMIPISRIDWLWSPRRGFLHKNLPLQYPRDIHARQTDTFYVVTSQRLTTTVGFSTSQFARALPAAALVELSPLYALATLAVKGGTRALSPPGQRPREMPEDSSDHLHHPADFSYDCESVTRLAYSYLCEGRRASGQTWHV